MIVRALCFALVLGISSLAPLKAQTLASTGWSWPVLPASPFRTLPGELGLCDVQTLLTQHPQVAHVIAIENARAVNDDLPDPSYPAFQPGTTVVYFQTSSDLVADFTGVNRLVRLSSSKGGAQYGAWWTTFAQVSSDGEHLLPASIIANRLALTYIPGCIAYARSVPVSTTGYFGMVAKEFGGQGGAIELWFPSGKLGVDPNSVQQLAGGPPCNGL